MCCSSKTKLDLTPVEFSNSSHIAEVKRSISRGIVPYDCESCVKLESQNYPSTRTLALQDWDYTIDTVPNDILYLDLRHSNLCNFSCRSCEPSFSSEIARELQKNLKLKKYHSVTDIHLENTKSQEGINNLLPTVQRINFTGGEPLLIKKNIDILEDLISTDNTNCEILITTNASVINNKILDLIGHFNQVHWTLSIDAVGSVAEYVRHGTVWETVDHNIRKILSIKQSVAFNTTITAYNILDLSTLLEYFKELKNLHSDQPLELWFSVCLYPEFLNPLVSSISMKNKALDELAKSIDILSTVDNPNRAIQTLKSLQKNLKESIINVKALNNFISYTKDLDQIRNQNFEQVFKISL